MKLLVTMQTLVIILLFVILLSTQNFTNKEFISQKNIDSIYFSQKDSFYYSNKIDSLDNELLIKTIDLGRYDAALEGIDKNCKKQFQANLVE